MLALEPEARNPDLIVTYPAGAQNHVASDLGPRGVGYDGYYGGYYGDELYDYQAGSLLIDVIDAHTNQLVWRSVAVADDEDFRNRIDCQRSSEEVSCTTAMMASRTEARQRAVNCLDVCSCSARHVCAGLSAEFPGTVDARNTRRTSSATIESTQARSPCTSYGRKWSSGLGRGRTLRTSPS